jgi:hypothetical protein
MRTPDQTTWGTCLGLPWQFHKGDLPCSFAAQIRDSCSQETQSPEYTYCSQRSSVERACTGGWTVLCASTTVTADPQHRPAADIMFTGECRADLASVAFSACHCDTKFPPTTSAHMCTSAFSDINLQDACDAGSRNPDPNTLSTPNSYHIPDPDTHPQLRAAPHPARMSTRRRLTLSRGEGRQQMQAGARSASRI